MLDDTFKEPVSGRTILHWAVATRQKLKYIKDLIEAGAVVDAKDQLGATSLLHACRNGNLEIAKLFISKGAELDQAKLNGETLLCRTYLHGHRELVELLIKSGANINADSVSGPLLCLACERNDIALV